jgi:GT2 family glycosyltransferase
MKISVIIANFNGERFIVNCLQSIFKEKSNGYEIIVVDDASQDKSVAFIEKKFSQEKRLRLIKLPENLGAAQARNIGVANSAGRYLFFLDSDTEVEPGWSNSILAFFETEKEAGLAQVKLLKKGTNCFDSAGDYLSPFGFLIERGRGAKDEEQFDQSAKIFSGKSAAMIVRKEVFLKLGGFDGDYQIFLEDTDLAWRMWLLGYEVYFFPKITVWHRYGCQEKSEDYYQKLKVHYLGCRNMLTTQIKNLGVKKLTIILPIQLACWFILSLLFLLKADWQKCLDLWQGILWNFLNLKTILKKRNNIQKTRKITDEQLFALIGARKDLSYYLGKGLSYVLGKPF